MCCRKRFGRPLMDQLLAAERGRGRTCGEGQLLGVAIERVVQFVRGCAAVRAGGWKSRCANATYRHAPPPSRGTRRRDERRSDPDPLARTTTPPPIRRAGDDLGAALIAVPHPGPNLLSQSLQNQRRYSSVRSNRLRSTSSCRCNAAAPAPNSSKTTNEFASAYTSNGTGGCCQRKSASSAFTVRASASIT